MRTAIGRAAVLFVLAGFVTNVAANENAAGVVDKRGLSPIVNAPPSSSPVVMVAEASSQQSKNILGVCRTVDGKTSIYPTFNAGSYMYQFYGKDFSDTGATAKIIQSPKHGTLIPTQVSTANNFEYTYTPDQLPPGTKDYFVVSVENGGVAVIIRYYIYINFLDPNEPADVNFCGEKQFWKISLDPNGNSILTAIGNLSPVAIPATNTASS